MLKNPEGSTFYIFRHCDTVQISHFFRKVSNVSIGILLFFFHIFNLEFQKAQRVPSFTILKNLRILSLRYIAAFGRSRLVRENSYRSFQKLVDYHLTLWLEMYRTLDFRSILIHCGFHMRKK